ncbi:adenylate/guanylate cyclase domain-containing protein [Bradyrhizobium septentrionale]|uniref:adenylate/guanylate cyclase domain-containing protein n=1 Tax=Bradyrhizobium septentrionale TaxID=1404411 RepID=UPI0030CAB163
MDISGWLRGLGLERYEPAFRENAIDEAILPKLTAEDLRDLGVTAVGHRRILVDAIAALRAEAFRDTPELSVEPDRSGGKAPEAERRQLTIMFADLVGSTALSARLDPEELRDIIGAYHRRCAEVITRSGGFVAKYLGDGVLAYFGYPQAHEEDAEQAVRAGLALIEAVAKLDGGQATSLQVRVGIATGLVVVGDLLGEGAAQEQAVIGETPNLAARLQGLAEPHTVVIADNTRRLLGGLFDYRDLGTVPVAGIHYPVRVWRVVGASLVGSRFEALRAASTPLIGREEEIALLTRRWERAKAGDGSVVLIAGEPGIGKSRIAQTLLEQLSEEPHTRLRYFCSPHHQHSALYPSITQLEQAAGFRREDTAETRLDKLVAVLAMANKELSEAVPLLADLLSIPTGDRYPPLNFTPQKRKEKTLHVQVAQVEGLAARQPLLMLWEDIHWSDPTTLESLDLLIDRAATLRVLVILTFRPEFSSPWVGRPHVTLLSLNRLSPRHRAEMIAHITGGKTLPPEIANQIIDRTDGVPLFIEELTKSVVESGWMTDAGDHYSVPGPVLPLAIPTTLHASLLARLDRLAPTREVVQIAATLGRQFSHELISAVAAMSQPQLEGALVQLIRAELVFRRGTPPDATYTFKHALVQDTAYGTLLRSKRQQLHARIAQALEEKFPDIAATQPEVLAHHFTEADLTENAVAYWRKAGQRAAERSAHAEAIAHLRKGLMVAERVSDPAERARRELDLQLVLAPVLITTKSWAAPEVEQAYLRARDLCRQVGDVAQLFTVSWGLWLVYQQRCEFKMARDLLDELFAVARRRADPALLLQAHHAAWTTLLNLPELTACRAHLEAGLALYRPDAYRAHKFLYGSHDAAVCNLYTAAAALWPLGFPEQALATAREAVSMARELSHPFSLVLALVFAAMIYQHRREAEPAREQAEAAIAVCAEHDIAPHLAAAGSILRGWAIAVRGKAAEGIAEVRDGLAAVQPTGVRIRRPYYLALLAEASTWAGEIEQGLIALAEAAAAVEETGERRWEAEIYRLLGELTVARRGGDRTEAEACFRRALDVAGRQSAKALELRATTSLARLWCDQGKQQQAHDLLAPVYGWFTEGFDTPDLREARALLDALR